MSALPQPQPLPPSPDTDLVASARAGDVAAFEQLYRRHVGRVHAVCLRLCGDRDQAEQLAQDTFVRAWRHLPGFRGAAGFGTWLYRLAANVSIDWHRAQARRHRRETWLDLADQRGDLPTSPPRVGGLDLDRALATLPAGARAAFVLHEVEGYPVREAAALMGVSEGTVKTQLFRARRQLREVLQ